MSFKCIVTTAVFIACCQSPMVQAALISLDEFDSGNFIYQNVECVPGGSESFSHTTGLDEIEYQVTSCAIPDTAVVKITWGYLIFDLASITAPVSSAAVSFTIDGLTGVGGTLVLYDYTLTSASDLSDLPAGSLPVALGEDIFSDISSGNLLGSVDLDPGSSSGVYDLQLSSYALGQINSASGLLAFGVSYLQSGFGGLFFENISIARPTRLKLDVPNAGVPVPGTLWLLAFAGILLRVHSRRAGR